MRVRYTIEIRDYHEFFSFMIIFIEILDQFVIDIAILHFLQNRRVYNI